MERVGKEVSEERRNEYRGDAHLNGAYVDLLSQAGTLTSTAVIAVGFWKAIEVRAQGQFTLLPPSHHPNDPQTDNPSYRFVHRSREIARVESLRELDWIPLEPAPLVQRIPVPKKALQHLKGKFTKY
jgi:hypothetical protein